MTPEHILFGSDYPHPEGLAEPFAWAEEVSNLYPPAAVEKIMGGNMFELLGLKVPA
jgi:predicted TIM-barrel fold metal-dependent hydrolase